MVNGVDELFIIPPLALALLVAVIVAWRLPKHGAKGAIVPAAVALIGGGVILFLVYVILIAMYFANGGH
jgi:hypothetical protein